MINLRRSIFPISVAVEMFVILNGSKAIFFIQRLIIADVHMCFPYDRKKQAGPIYYTIICCMMIKDL